MSSLIDSIDQLTPRTALSRALMRVSAILLLAGAGWLDYVTGPEVSSAPFYVVVLVATALVEPWGACLGYSILSACIYLAVDLLTIPVRASLVFPYWDATARLLSFSLISIAVSLLMKERRHLRRSEDGLRARSQELEERNRQLEEALRTITRLQGELVTRERQSAVAEAVTTAAYEMERPLASASMYVAEIVRLLARAHSAENWHLILDEIQPLSEKLEERVRDMERIVEDIRSLRNPEQPPPA